MKATSIAMRLVLALLGVVPCCFVLSACSLPSMRLEPSFAQRSIDWSMPEVYGIWPPSSTRVGPFTVSDVHVASRQGVEAGAVHQVGGFDLTLRVSAGADRVDDIVCHGSGTPRRGDELTCTFSGPLGPRTLRNVSIPRDPRELASTQPELVYVLLGVDTTTERARVVRSVPEGFQTGTNGYYIVRGDTILGAIDLHVLGVPRAHADQELDAYTQHEIASVMAVLFVVEGFSFD